jgi:hypothetical protein
MEPLLAKNRLEKGLEGLHPCVAESLKDPEFNLVEDSEEGLVHMFSLEGRSGRRIKFKNISRNGNNPFAHTKVAEEVKDKIFEKATPPQNQGASPVHHGKVASGQRPAKE